MVRRVDGWLAVGIWVLWLAGCAQAEQSAAGGSCGVGRAPGSDDSAAIEALLAAEGELVVAQSIDALMALWSAEGYVADAKHTPERSDDDQFWRGLDAIRHRYVRTVFPGAPATASRADLSITVAGSRATVLATTQIGAEIAKAGDRWGLVRLDGCWFLENLTYNLERTAPSVP
ncbi:MAG: hypothetical protein ACOYL7_11265 [Caldilinea sp.]